MLTDSSYTDNSIIISSRLFCPRRINVPVVHYHNRSSVARANRPVILFLTDGAWTSSARYLLPELLFFGGVGFHVLPQGAGISVALCTPGHLTRVRLLDKHGEMRKVRSGKAGIRPAWLRGSPSPDACAGAWLCRWSC